MKSFKLLVVAAAVLLASCGTQKKSILYLQDAVADQPETIVNQYELKIKPSDILGVTVNSRYAELAAPFNLSSITFQNATTGKATGNQAQGQVVDDAGFISMPVLGKIKAAGLTRSELAADIEQRLITGGHIKDPVVNIQFLNFKINVLGEVSRPGEFAINSDRVTLFDALSMAGDITDYGVKERITVIREQNGQRTIGYLDATSTDVFKSPYYYLQQNDIIIVDPDEIKQANANVNQKGRNTLSTVTSILSILVTVTSLTLTLTRLK
ncbi:MAG: polysaccharide biosynthesis/export family protein [Rikenellaceae bacterium]|nr:polysaccharide biosynthesis/export family protein [Rikenellaceae bacterium]MBP3612353.1 polysaccharide biosynthesis/export family protein [Rikenellaceae bacterium]